VIALAVVVGLLIGSIPTAQIVSRRRGVDLSAGSGNPGTANALRLGGTGIAATILTLDLAKGVIAAILGWALSGPGGGVAAGLAAIAGQVANPWLGFRGGKGLAVTAGATAVLFSTGLAICLVVIAAAARILGSARGALIAIAVFLTASVVWVAAAWPTVWGIPADGRLVTLGIGVAVTVAPKLIRDIINGR